MDKNVKGPHRDLDDLYHREELLWRDKAKARWLDEGDANTYYFHLTAIIHQRYDTINTILNDEHVWVSKWHLIRIAFENYFANIFTSVSPRFSTGLQELIKHKISEEMNTRLTAIPMEDEFKRRFSQWETLKVLDQMIDEYILQNLLEDY